MSPLRRWAFRDLQGKAFEAIVYRHVSSQHDPLDSSGSLKAGGRWNPQGEYGVLYTALNEETAKAELERLAERQGLTRGVLQPILVRRSGEGYELIAGERRLRAAVRAGLREVPVIVLDDLAPRDLVSIEVSLSKVLDLTDKKILEQIGINENEIVGNNISLCLEISRRARRAGFEAILAPSATKKGAVLVVFPDRLRPASRLEVVGKKKFL